MTSYLSKIGTHIADNWKLYAGGVAVAGVIALNVQQTYNPRANPKDITLQGAPNHYHLVDYNIPTKGSITNIVMDTANLKKETRANGDTLIYHGAFNYSIKPNASFTPSGEPEQGHSDIKGNTPENNNYFSDVRSGTITLARNK